jgi:hypothetical protein
MLLRTAMIWVSTSSHSRPCSSMRCRPRTCPSIRRRRVMSPSADVLSTMSFAPKLLTYPHGVCYHAVEEQVKTAGGGKE